MLFITSQTCQTTFPSPNFGVPTQGSGMLFRLLISCSDLCLGSLELLWNLGNVAWPLNASCGVSWCFCMSVSAKSMNQGHSVRSLSDRGSFIVRSTDHTVLHTHTYLHTFLDEEGCVVFKVAFVAGRDIYWFSCWCLTCIRQPSVSCYVGFYSHITYFLSNHNLSGLQQTSSCLYGIFHWYIHIHWYTFTFRWDRPHETAQHQKYFGLQKLKASSFSKLGRSQWNIKYASKDPFNFKASKQGILLLY